MTSNLKIPKILKVSNTMGIKSFIDQKMTKTVKFMGKDLIINKLTVAQVLEIQDQAKLIEKNENEGFNVMKTVIRSSADGGSELSDEDFNQLPLDELSKLANEVMKFSGISGDNTQGKQ